MKDEKREIEVCNSNEWLTVYGPLSDIDGSDVVAKTEACDIWHNAVWTRLEALGYRPRLPRDGHTSCHGWHGANTFRRGGHGLGTFDTFNDREWNEITGIAIEEAVKLTA